MVRNVKELAKGPEWKGRILTKHITKCLVLVRKSSDNIFSPLIRPERGRRPCYFFLLSRYVQATVIFHRLYGAEAGKEGGVKALHY